MVREKLGAFSVIPIRNEDVFRYGRPTADMENR